MDYIYFNEHGRIMQTASNTSEHEAIETANNTGYFYQVHDGQVDSDANYMCDGVVTHKGECPSHYHVFDYIAREWTDPRNLDELKARKWVDLRTARNAQEFGGFDWDGFTFDSDMVSQQRIAMACQEAQLVGETFSKVWTLADNSFKELSATEIVSVGVAMADHVSAVHEKARNLRSAVILSDSKVELESISW